MKKSYGEGLATHTGPESCGAAREGGVEAWTGGSSRQGCESGRVKAPTPPVACIGRLAYPVRAEATKHDRPGRKNLGCPASLGAAVGTTWEVSKLGGLNIKKCLQPRKTLREKSCSRVEAGSRPTPLLGKADDREEGTGMCTPWDRRGMGPGI